jgi:hypothetical protein
MKSKILALLLVLAGAFQAAAQGTAFTYQGRLNDAAGPANGTYDLRFKLFLDSFGNNQAGTTSLVNGHAVSNGLFTVTLDFGPGVFNGSNYWLEVDVKTNGGATYTSLNPLQPITPVPYAVFAENVVGGLAAGTYTNAVTLNNSANVISGSFYGNGTGISNVNAVTLNGVTAGAFWQLGGNNVAGGQFLGSTNNQPVEIWANGTRSFRVEPNTNGAPNVIGGAPINYVDPGIVGATIAGGGNVSGSFYLGGGSNHVAAIFGTIAGGRVNTVAADHAFIGGGISNSVQLTAYDSVIGGGVANVIATNSSESVLVGGTYNSIQLNSYYSVIGGGGANSIQTNSGVSVIAGGYANTIQANAGYSVVGGGYDNTIQTGSTYAHIGGGYFNNIQPGAYYSVLGGGYFNNIQSNAYYSFLGGGIGNTIQTNAGYSVLVGGNNNVIQTNASYSVLAGGRNNTIQTNANNAFLGGGQFNTIRSNAIYCVIGGGEVNTIQTNSSYTIIGAGYNNLAAGQASVLAGGYYNVNTGDLAVVSGGFLNLNSAQFGTVGGGASNTNSAYAGTVGGGVDNLSSGYGASVAGGQGNIATNTSDTIGGGSGNLSGGYISTVAGGYQNRALGDYSAIAGGGNNAATGPNAFVGAGAVNSAGGFYGAVVTGYGNIASGGYAMIGGGYSNVASGLYATVGCGYNNVASGQGATVAGGFQNTASGDYSFAAGRSAYVPSPRSFVWNSFPNPNYAVNSDEFQIFATNGFSVDYNTQLSGGGGSRWLYIGKGNVGFPGTPATISTWTGAYLSDGGSWTSASDRTKKGNFIDVDSLSVLGKVLALPIQTWNYTNEPAAIRHLGPMAQDFHAAFGLNGQDDKHIADVDEAGVALAAIQGLNQKEEEDRTFLKAKDTEIEELKAQNRDLSRRLSQLETLVSTLATRTP